MNRASIFALAGMWIVATVGASAEWQIVAANWVALIQTAVITLGSTAILLGQKHYAARREEHAKDLAVELDARSRLASAAAADLAAGLASTRKQTQADTADVKGLIGSLKDRLDAVVAQRDHLLAQNETLALRLCSIAEHQGEMSAKLDRTRCQFPKPDGTAKCLPDFERTNAGDTSRPQVSKP